MHSYASALKIKFEAITVVNTPSMFVAILLASVYFSFNCITNDSLGYDTDYSNLNTPEGRYCRCLKKPTSSWKIFSSNQHGTCGRPEYGQPSSNKPAHHFFVAPHKTGTTPFNLCNMELYLSLHPKILDACELKDSFKYGFKYNYFGPRFASN